MSKGFTAEPDTTMEIDFGAPDPGLNKMTDISGYDPLEEAVIGGFEGEPVQESVEEQPQPAPLPPPQAQQDDRQVKGNVFARLRVVERERDIEKRRAKEAQDRLVQVLEMVLDQDQPEQEPEEDYHEIDPVARLERKVDRVARTLEEEKLAEEQAEREQEAMQELMTANMAIRQFAAQAGPLYTSAIAHLAAMEMDEYLEEHPNVTPQEAELNLLQEMENNKVKWLQQGRNPGQELFKRAIRRGFTFPVEQARAAQAPPRQAPPARQSATEEVRREQGRSVRSLGPAQGGAAPQATNARTLATASESDFQDKVLRMVQERGGPALRRSPKMREVLAGKGRIH